MRNSTVSARFSERGCVPCDKWGLTHCEGAPLVPRWLLGELGLQKFGRRKARTSLLVAAVAISSAIVFTGVVMMRSIETSMAVGFSRLGADLMIVAQNALTNITVALLTVKPTDETLMPTD